MDSLAEQSIREEELTWFRARMKQFADQVCMIAGAVESKYSDLEIQIENSRAVIEKSEIPVGSTVALIGDFGIQTVGAFFALAERNAFVVPMVESLNKTQIAGRLREARADWLWEPSQGLVTKSDSTSEGNHRLINELRQQKRAGLILFSSGSVGKPKAMIHDLAKLLSVYYVKKPRRLRILCFLMFDHIGGLNTMLNSFASGATLVIPENHEPEYVAELIEQQQVNILPTSPTFLNLLLMSEATEKFDLSSLKIITYGTEPMSEGLLARLRSAFPRTRLLQTFGTSETGISRTVSKSSTSTLMRIDDPNVEHKIVDTELWLRSRTQILGYLNHDDNRFTSDGWFKTGDIVELAEDGFLRIVGRREELINVGGEKVAPIEIEGVLMQLKEVSDCRVFAMPNTITGQSVAVEIVAKEPNSLTQLKRIIRKHCRSRLESFKIPTKITIVDATKFSTRFKKSRLGH